MLGTNRTQYTDDIRTHAQICTHARPLALLYYAQASVLLKHPGFNLNKLFHLFNLIIGLILWNGVVARTHTAVLIRVNLLHILYVTSPSYLRVCVCACVRSLLFHDRACVCCVCVCVKFKLLQSERTPSTCRPGAVDVVIDSERFVVRCGLFC